MTKKYRTTQLPFPSLAGEETVFHQEAFIGPSILARRIVLRLPRRYLSKRPSRFARKPGRTVRAF